jgi:hypothetical protein
MKIESQDEVKMCSGQHSNTAVNKSTALSDIGCFPDVASFNEHLDVCRKCRENPFGLCTVGVAILTGMT